jgi:xanthine dehydrogenase YagS FAD-binding subunit
MRRFQHLAPRTLNEALEVLGRHPTQTRVIAGGQDLLFRIKKHIVQPDYVVDIKRIDDLARLSEERNGSNGREPGTYVGALRTLTDLQRNATIRDLYSAVAEGAAEVASPQIRNVGTLGGNLLQDVWCWYLQCGFNCWKAGGKKCDLAIGDARYYGSVFLGNKCQANHPSDVAPALLGFDAKAVIAGATGKRRVSMEQLLPGHTMVEGVLQSHSVRPDEILAGVYLPPPPPNTRSTYSKFALRGSWDFAIAAAAVRLSFESDVCTDARIVLGGVATRPLRRPEAEALLVGQRITPELAVAAGETAVKGARPLKTNGYKVDIARTLVKRSIGKLAGVTV